MIRPPTVQPGIVSISELFSLEEGANAAISVQVQEAIRRVGGLASMTAALSRYDIHPAVEKGTEELVDRLEREALVEEVSTVRSSGSVEDALEAMCDRSSYPFGLLPLLLGESGGLIAPVVFYSRHRDMHMVNGDLTVYRSVAYD